MKKRTVAFNLVISVWQHCLTVDIWLCHADGTDKFDSLHVNVTMADNSVEISPTNLDSGSSTLKTA